jgi:hypothetical protein
MSPDLALARLSRDAYNPAVTGQVIDWRDMRAVATGSVLAVRGTCSYANAARDMAIAASRPHPVLGPCVEGAIDAAEGLLPLIPRGIDTVTGHSLGGQVAVLLAALLPGVRLLVTWDAPKPGGAMLAAHLAGMECRQHRFRGSVVSGWPFFLDQHVREPLLDMCDWTPDVVRAHSIERACAWLEAHGGE